jgi:cytochrome P450
MANITAPIARKMRPPGPRSRSPLGMASAFSADQIGFVHKAAQTYGDLVYFRLAHIHFYLISHPDFIQQVLVTHAPQMEKASLDKRIFRQSMGNSIFTLDGNPHKAERRLMQPLFHSKRVDAYAQTMIDYTDQMLNRWRDGQMIDAHHEMTDLTIRIVVKTLYSAEMDEDNSAISKAMETLVRVGNNQFKQGFAVPPWLPVGQTRRWRGAVGLIDAKLKPLIAARRAGQEDSGDLLSMLVLAKDEVDGSSLNDQQILDEMRTLFMAGHETTANTLVWALYLLSDHPEVERKLCTEIDNVLAGQHPTVADLKKLTYLDAVIKEAMRLYPPAWGLNARTNLEEIELGGYTIPKGSTLFICPYVTHHDPRWFPDPEAFKPERWENDLEKRLPKYAYFPFGGGPHVCIGTAFALMEAKLILATIARRYHVRNASTAPLELEPLVTLRPKGKVPMLLQSRAQTGAYSKV